MKKKRHGEPQKAQAQVTQPVSLEERIRVRAHEIYLQRAGQEGSEIDDWLRAEMEITGA
ncbi:MAG TPA: DUF2934 domain-containing protein [Candidatus Sulfopaludibacter sp.]|nr:DUF2934 domain-containing protein [Candidatus Sulfopaludibacter sp.]